MSDAKPERRWFRFGLRTLLAAVTLAAIGSWGYWVAWPWWQGYREQVEFEAAVRELRISGGESIHLERLPLQRSDTTHSTRDINLSYDIGKYVRRNASYCIVCSLRPPEADKFEYLKISAFRLQHAPDDYQPYREHNLTRSGPLTVGLLRELKYIDDFADFILGDTQDGRRYQYELIYSDPPDKPAK
jgi:hypothetical protein